MFEKIAARLRRPVSNAFLTVFRIFFGIWMVIRCIWYIVSQDVRYVEHTQILFSYRGWEWVPHAPAQWFIVLMWISLFSAVGIALGIFTRVSAFVFLMTFGYFFIVDAATWGNMDYLFSLLAFILLLVPSGARFSWDASRQGTHLESVPAWTLHLLRFQIGVVYFYAGLIKCTPDWLLRASPIDIFLSTENKIAVLQPLFENPLVVHAFAYGGCFFDLFIVPLLLWPRSRRWAMGLVVFFHTFNMVVLGLGNVTVFMMLATLLVFSEPDLFEAVLTRFENSLKTVGSVPKPSRLVFVAAAFVVLQTLIPLRHLAYPGDARWNGDGQNFSWWMRSIHMKVDSKFYAEYDGKRVRLDPLKTIAKEQSAMGKDPDMMAQYARYVASGLRAEGHQDVKVMVESTASLNGRPAQRFIREDVDLGALGPGFVPADIVVPLD